MDGVVQMGAEVPGVRMMGEMVGSGVGDKAGVGVRGLFDVAGPIGLEVPGAAVVVGDVLASNTGLAAGPKPAGPANPPAGDRMPPPKPPGPPP